MHAILDSPQGGTARDLLRRGLRVESAAKRNLGSNPKRVDTGRLRGSVTHQLLTTTGARGSRLSMRVGTNVSYARMVHDGTGIYGPYGEVIRPKNKKVLRWRSKAYGAKKGKSKGYAFARYVVGMRPNPFLKKAIPAARG
jgi:hypothetical protein